MTVLVTGASGFVGTAVCRELCDTGESVVAVVRDDPAAAPPRCRGLALGDLTRSPDWVSTWAWRTCANLLKWPVNTRICPRRTSGIATRDSGRRARR